MHRIETIQALRFAAAGLVVLAHCASGYFLPGVAGVDIFFVISGFIITRVLGNRSAGEFALDRATRIYPIYWIALLPFLGSDLTQLLTSLTLWPWFGTLELPFLTVGWTLSYELLFYLAAGLVLWRKWTIVLLLTAYVSCLLFGMENGSPLLGYLGNPMVLEFLFGVGLARLPPTSHRTCGVAALAFGAVAIFLLADPAFGSSDAVFRISHRALVWGPAACLIVWGGLQWEGFFSGRLWRFLVAGGEASYALYLFHPTVLLFAPTDPYLRLLTMPFVCVAAGFLIHRMVEKPLTRRARALLSPRSTLPVLNP